MRAEKGIIFPEQLQAIGLNNLLSAIFNQETRLSLLLEELGFSDEQIKTIKEKHREPLTLLVLETL